ncbi:hypothetical protein [Aridibaculum aurantiacum]|uniref:hypothetical protein n=1 Tax=Aridibaculum aurantiacum TaxID=2810307 RepID=UPI001A95B6A8|nr:hypothetical protein [Aridibaculum aurantiacum]
MQYKKSLAIVVFTAITAFYSCTKKAETRNELVGKWKWVKTEGGIAGHILETPETTGRNVQLQFHHSRHYELHTNGSLSAEGSYTLETKKCIHDHADKTFIRFSGSTPAPMMVEKTIADTLVLSDEAFDGMKSSYVRVQ